MRLLKLDYEPEVDAYYTATLRGDSRAATFHDRSFSRLQDVCVYLAIDSGTEVDRVRQLFSAMSLHVQNTPRVQLSME